MTQVAARSANMLRQFASVTVCVAMLSTALVARGQSVAVTDEDTDTWLVSQPAVDRPAPESTTAPARTASQPAQSRSRRSSAWDSYARLARAPNMFGDTIRPSATLIQDIGNVAGQQAQFDTILAAGGSYNVAENNSSLPTDRIYFLYNGFNNAVSINVPGNTPRAIDFQMYTAGFEKTWLDGTNSIEVRMPFTSGPDYTLPGIASDSGHFGNISMFLKHLAYFDDSLAMGGGLGIALPTGSNLVTQVAFNRLEVQNEAVHLMPFLALTMTPSENWFIQAFTQFDFAANGNEVITNNQTAGRFTEQNLWHADATFGRWLARDLEARYLDGIAGLVELHYTTTINDADIVPLGQGGFTRFMTVPANRVDLLNLTAGLHFQLSELATLRVAAVAPLKTSPDRVFDSEIVVAFNRFF